MRNGPKEKQFSDNFEPLTKLIKMGSEQSREKKPFVPVEFKFKDLCDNTCPPSQFSVQRKSMLAINTSEQREYFSEIILVSGGISEFDEFQTISKVYTLENIEGKNLTKRDLEPLQTGRMCHSMVQFKSWVYVFGGLAKLN